MFKARRRWYPSTCIARRASMLEAFDSGFDHADAQFCRRETKGHR